MVSVDWLSSEVKRLSDVLERHMADCTKVREDTRNDIKVLEHTLGTKIDTQAKIQDDRLITVTEEQNKLTLRVAVAVISLLFTVVGLLLRKQGFF